MRDFSEKGNLNAEVILSIMQEEKPNQVEQFKIPKDRISEFFKPGTPTQKIEDARNIIPFIPAIPASAGTAAARPL